MAAINRRVLLGAIAAVTAAPTVSVANEKLEGKVVRTNLTLCQPRPNGGGCEGTLTLETTVGGKAQQVAIRVIADTIIKKGSNFMFLPQTNDQSVTVTYVMQKGQRVAQLIEVK